MKTPSSINTIIVLGSLLLHLTTFSIQSRAAAGDVDLTFDPGTGVNGPVSAVALQPDGRIIIAGQFTTVKGLARANVARLNADGSGDATFNPGTAASGPVRAVALHSDGKVIITFQSTPSQPEAVRLNSDGSLDNSFLRQNGNAYPSGGELRAVVVQPDGKVVFGGTYNGLYFDEEGGGVTYQRFRIYRVNSDGSNDNSFSYDNSLPLDYNFLNLHCLALQPDGKVLIGGNGTLGGGMHYNGITRLNSNGSLDSGFNPGAGTDSVFSIAVQPDGKVLIGGGFTTVNGSSRNGIARLNANGSLDFSFDPGSGTNIGGVFSVALQADGKVLIGGGFTTVNGTIRSGIARLNDNGSLDTSFNPGTGIGGYSKVIFSVVVQTDGKAIIGGSFTTVNGTTRECMARLNVDGTLDSSFDPGTGITNTLATYAEVKSVAVQPDGKVLIGGEFTRVKGVDRVGIARLNVDGSLDASFNPGTGAGGTYPWVNSVVVQSDGKVIIGGTFGSVNGMGRSGMARLHADGSLDGSFDPNRGNVTAIALQADGKIVFDGGGIFRLNTNGSLDGSFNANYPIPAEGYPDVRTVAVQADGKVLIGGYSYEAVYDPVNETYIDTYAYLLIRLNADGSNDASFEPATGVPGPEYIKVSAVAVQADGKVLIGGNFTSVKGANRVGIARLNANGSLDLSFNPGTGASGVSSIALQPDGKVLIGGDFSSVNGTNRNRIARLNADGSLDSSFNPGTGAIGSVVNPRTGTIGGVGSIVVQADGNLLMGGDFAGVNGIARPLIARLLGNSQPPATFAGWVASFGLSGALTKADADPDLDGLASALEYILGGNPAQSNPTTPRPAASLIGGGMSFTFSRIDASETPDVTLTVESGTDLVTWPDVFTIGSNTAASTPGVTILENGTAPDTITVAIPAGSGNARFARMRATVAP